MSKVSAMLDGARKILSTFDDKVSANDVGATLLFTLALHSVLGRNKEQTLCEHFDGIREAYSQLFLLLQRTGIEQEYERSKSR